MKPEQKEANGGDLLPRHQVIERIEKQIRLWNNDTVTMACADMLADLKQMPASDDASQGADDGSADWCDDCHGYTHKYDCPNKRYQVKTPLVDRVVDAVYRSMARYESGEWWMDTLKAKVKVNRLLAESDPATSMRSACLGAVKLLWSTNKGNDYNGAINDAVAALESVSIQEHEAKQS